MEYCLIWSAVIKVFRITAFPQIDCKKWRIRSASLQILKRSPDILRGRTADGVIVYRHAKQTGHPGATEKTPAGTS